MCGRYSDKQIESLRLWILYIAERDGIDVRKGLPELIKEKGADAFEFNERRILWTSKRTMDTYQYS